MAATKNHKHTLRSVLVFFSVLSFFLAIFFLIQIKAHAEGSNELNMIDPVLEGNAYRAFLEWDKGQYDGGVERATLLKIIMKQGETVCLGTSVTGAADGDILVRCQIDGKETKLYANASSGVGYIRSRAMELAGPNHDGSNLKGYLPLEFVAPYTGVYELEFHSKGTALQNPAATTLDKSWSTQGASVAAFDATVIDYNGNPVQGRLFTNYLAINTGTNKVGMYSSLHILTTDGYQYNLETNGIGPWGFILYANNVGVLNGPTGLSLYKNAVLIQESGKNVPQGGVVVPTADWHNKLSVFTHRIFFNDPDDEIADILPDFPLKPAPMAEIQEFRFVGNKNDDNANKTEVGAGGTFYLEFSDHCTFDIIIDTNKDGKFDPYDDVMLPAAASQGANSILWDGKDHNGDNVEADTYHMQLRVHGGEFHFPMIDAERCPDGVKIKLMNPTDYQRATNYDLTTVYFDARDYRTYNGTNITQTGNNPPDPKAALEGTSSANGAYGYGVRTGEGAGMFGDNKIMDIWTYALGDPANTKIVSKIQIGVEAATGTDVHGAIMATIFFDSNKDKTKQDAEVIIPGVDVALYRDAACNDSVLGDDGTPLIVKSNGRGQVVFGDVPYDATSGAGTTYYLKPNPVVNGITHTITTGEVQAVVLKSSTAFSKNIGLYAAHDVSVAVSADQTDINSGDEITFTVTVTNTKPDYVANNTEVKMPVPDVNGEPVVFSATQGSYANGKWSVGTLGAGQAATLVIKMNPIKVDPPGTTSLSKEIIYEVTASCNDDENIANNKANVKFTVKQRPEYQIVYHANYEASAGTSEATLTQDRSVDTDPDQLQANTFTRPFYNFMGWALNKNNTIPKYSDKESYTGTGGSVLHLYAVWKQHAPDVQVALTASPAIIDAGETIDLTVTVRNTATDPAKDTFVKIPFPNIEGVPVLTGSAVGSTSYNATTKEWTWQAGELAGGASASCTLRIMPVFAGGGVQTTEAFTATTGCILDADLMNNEGSTSVKINPAEAYKITYEPNGGEGTAETEVYEYTTGGKTLKKNRFLKPGFVFLGWSTSPGASIPEYADEDVYKALAGSNVKLYAVWSKNPDPPVGDGSSSGAGIGGNDEGGIGGGHEVSGEGAISLAGDLSKPGAEIPIFEKESDVPDPMGADAPPAIRLMRDGFEKIFYKTETPDGIVYRAEDGEVLGYKRSRSPWTGDNAKPMLWITLMLVSTGGVAFIVIRMGQDNKTKRKVRRKTVNRKKRKR